MPWTKGAHLDEGALMKATSFLPQLINLKNSGADFI